MSKFIYSPRIGGRRNARVSLSGGRRWRGGSRRLERLQRLLDLGREVVARRALQGVDRILAALLLLERRRQVAPCGRVLRMLVDLLLQARDRRAAARAAAVEEVLQRVADAGCAGTDPEQHETEHECHCEEEVG